MKIASNQGFTNLEIIPYDIIHAMTPRALVRPLQSIAYFLEHTPLVRDLCGSLYLWGKKPGNERASRPYVSLANHKELFGAVSVVVPCYNEEMNISILVSTMIRCYGDYIQEIIVVNDNSTDNTAAVVTDLAEQDPRVKIVNRKPPGGVGRALRDGYAAASGRYILTMDCDFALIVPELRDLFDAIAEGHDGAIGSRFSYESTLLNYPFFKIFCNRCFHLIANLFLRLRIRDISNNLKLYRGEILKSLEIEQDNFAANAETGLKPLLAGYDIKEVPISWINRTIDMGTSSFGIAKVAPSYFFELVKIVWKEWRKPMTVRKASSKINDSEKL